MSITDELRKWGYGFCGSSYEAVNAIADRIDAEHEKAIRELNDLADNSMVLPVDADGVPIRVGDKVVDWDTPRLVVAVSEDSICLAGYESDSYYRMGIAKNYRHHHKPTVEDLLREMLKKWGDTPWDSDADDEEESLIAEYAAKLCLTDDAKEQ